MFGKYYFPAVQLPPKRIYHLRSDDTSLPESQINAGSSGLNSMETPIPKVVHQFCQMSLTEQAVALEHPIDDTQTIAYGAYNDMVHKHRGALEAVRVYISSNPSWVDLMTNTPLDDGPETAVSIHLENPPSRTSSIKSRIKGLASGVWGVVRKLTERVAPTVVKTPATIKKKDCKTDPVELGHSVPSNTVITTKHNRRFDWEEFSKGLIEEVKKAPKDWKPVIHHKAPPIFTWHENQAWDSMERVSKRLTVPTPNPWTNETFLSISEGAVPMLKKKVKDPKGAMNQYIYKWAYSDPKPKENEYRDPDRFDPASYLTILWMCGLQSASSKKHVPIEELFTDKDKSDIILFLAKCQEVIDPRVRKAVSHYGHTPVMYAAGDGTSHYPGTDTLWGRQRKFHV